MNEIFLFTLTRFIKNIAKTHTYHKRNVSLFENIIIRDCYEERTIIDLFFTINALINRVIKMRNKLFDEKSLFIQTYVKLRIIKKSTWRFRRD